MLSEPQRDKSKPANLGAHWAPNVSSPARTHTVAGKLTVDPAASPAKVSYGEPGVYPDPGQERPSGNDSFASTASQRRADKSMYGQAT